ncbi:MAG: glycosyltransferase, partial [Patescibacteria group bacterium]
ISYERSEETRNFAIGHNVLLTKHNAELIQVLNDDAFLEPTYLEEVVRYMEAHPECGAASGRIFRWDFDRRDESDQGKTLVIDAFGLEQLPSGKVQERFRGRSADAFQMKHQDEEVFGVSGCLPLYRRAAVVPTSPDKTLFDPSFISYKEDVEVAYRLKKAGYSSALVWNAVAYHRRSFTVNTHAKQSAAVQLQSYRNHLWILFMHWRSHALARRLVPLVLFEGAKMGYWLLHRPSIVFRAWGETWKERGTLRRKREWYRGLTERVPAPTTFPAPQPKYDVAVITVTHNDLNEAYLSSLRAAMAATSLRVQAIIVDNDSTAFRANEVVERFLSKDATVILRNADFGFGHSCNRGAKEAEAEYLFFLNPDSVLPDPFIFDTLYRLMRRRPGTGILAPKVLYFDGRLQETPRRFPKWYMPFVQRTALKDSSFGKRYASAFTMEDYNHDRVRMIDWAQGSALFMSKAVFDEIGGFDQRFWMYFEDIDLCRRVWDTGRPVYYVPEAQLQHAYGKASAKEKGFVKNIITNSMARAHIVSWIKYLWKWR